MTVECWCGPQPEDERSSLVHLDCPTHGYGGTVDVFAIPDNREPRADDALPDCPHNWCIEKLHVLPIEHWGKTMCPGSDFTGEFTPWVPGFNELCDAVIGPPRPPTVFEMIYTAILMYGDLIPMAFEAAAAGDETAAEQLRQIMTPITPGGSFENQV